MHLRITQYFSYIKERNMYQRAQRSQVAYNKSKKPIPADLLLVISQRDPDFKIYEYNPLFTIPTIAQQQLYDAWFRNAEDHVALSYAIEKYLDRVAPSLFDD